MNIKKIRLTGGEPLLRQDMVELVKGIKDRGIEKIYITTNGILLVDKIDNLKNAGLDGVNISLDTLDREQFTSITRGGDLEKVLAGIKKSLQLNLEVKINSVIIKDINENAIDDLVKLTIDNKLDVRFIELMPIGQGKNFTGINNSEIYNRLEKNFGFDRDYKEIKGVSTYYKLKDSKGKIGFISPINNCFCETCNKIRLTSDGVIKRCLNTKGNINIKEYLDKNIGKDEIKEILKQEIFSKPEKHLFGKENKAEEMKNMNAIGG